VLWITECKRDPVLVPAIARMFVSNPKTIAIVDIDA
jgi:hypothetical protein